MPEPLLTGLSSDKDPLSPGYAPVAAVVSPRIKFQVAITPTHPAYVFRDAHHCDCCSVCSHHKADTHRFHSEFPNTHPIINQDEETYPFCNLPITLGTWIHLKREPQQRKANLDTLCRFNKEAILLQFLSFYSPTPANPLSSSWVWCHPASALSSPLTQLNASRIPPPTRKWLDMK